MPTEGASNKFAEHLGAIEFGRVWEKTKIILEMVKFPHTVFALPMALVSAFLAVRGLPRWDKLLLIILAMIGARNGAMAFNRLADAKYDALNPRTKKRALPQGHISKFQVGIFIGACSALFIFSAYLLNPLAFWLSFPTLIIIYTYSYTKRFTPYSHLILGVCLGLAPVGAWIGITGNISAISIVLGLAVVFWVAGFDILYACQDIEFDQQVGLYSIPSYLGLSRALWLSALFHLIMFVLLIWLKYLAQLGIIYNTGLVLIGLLLLYEHYLVRPHDLSRINVAFCTVNGVISVALLFFTLGDLVLFRII